MESPPPKKKKFLYNLCTTTVPCHRAYTIMVLNQKMPERKNWSQNIHYNGSKPENSRKEKLVTKRIL